MPEMDDPKTIGVVIGILLVLIGVVVMIGSASGAWTLEATPSKAAGILVGGFISILGAIITLACLEVLEDVAGALGDLWKAFVDAFRR